MLGTSNFFLNALLPVLDSDLVVKTNTLIKNQQLSMKKILKINGVDVLTLIDFETTLKTYPNQNVTVEWKAYDPRVRPWFNSAIQRAKYVSGGTDCLTEITDGVYFGSLYQSASDFE
jgi:hypothetical protein